MPWTCGLGDEAVLGGRGDQGLALGKALQGMAGNCANPPSHSLSGSSCLSLPAHVSAAWSCPCRELFLCPQVSSLSVPHRTRSVLSSALQTPPGSRTLPRDISVCAEAKEQLR